MTTRTTRRLASVVALLLGAGLLATTTAPPAGASTTLTGVLQVVAGGEHGCARLSGGVVRCWGYNNEHQLGNGTVGSGSSVAVPVLNPAGNTNLTGVTQVAAGADHTCALLNTGRISCWGENTWAQLGDGTNTPRSLPVMVVGINNAIQVTAGAFHSCALLQTKQVRCWGGNTSAQIGDNSSTGRPTPVAVRAVSGAGNVTNVTQISAGWYHTCARLTTGQVRCWGYGVSGQLGIGGWFGGLRPSIVRAVGTSNSPLTGVSTLVGGFSHTCARLANGQARCWGANGSSQLGNLATANKNRPVAVRAAAGAGNLTGVAQAVVGYNFSCFRTGANVRCLGDGSVGQLGTGDQTNSRRPVFVRNPADTAKLGSITQIAGGYGFACARSSLAGGTAYCWGYNSRGQVGHGTSDEEILLPTLVQS
jgi:alpha-tubulin suppressor-like RCC1 family protein